MKRLLKLGFIAIILGMLASLFMVAGPALAGPTPVVLTPNTGPVGTVITISGCCWAASEPITAVTIGGIVPVGAGSLTVNPAGTLSGTITVPAVPGGPEDVAVTGAISGTFHASFTVTTEAHFTPNIGPVGTRITVTGTGWGASDWVCAACVKVGGVIAAHGLSADVHGTLSGFIDVPPGVSAGLKDIVITATSGVYTFPGVFTVPVFTGKIQNLDVYQDSTGQVLNVSVTPSLGTKLGGFDISLGWDSDWVNITNAVVNADYLSVVKIDPVHNTISFSGTWNKWPVSPPLGDGITPVTVAQLVFDTKYAGAVPSTLDQPIWWNAASATVIGVGAAVDVTLVHPDSDCNMAVYADPSMYGYCKVTMGPAAGIVVNIAGLDGIVAPGGVNPSSFEAELTFGGTGVGAANAIQVVSVQGLNGWSVTGLPGWNNTYDVTGTRTPGAVDSEDVFLVKLRLVGSDTVLPSVSLKWLKIAGDDERGGSSPITPGLIYNSPLSFLRGDVNTDGGGPDIADATAAQRYLVGLETLTPDYYAGLLNCASVVHDGTGGDVINASDELRLMQYQAGLTDTYFNLTS
jgi:hypothetical protein